MQNKLNWKLEDQEEYNKHSKDKKSCKDLLLSKNSELNNNMKSIFLEENNNKDNSNFNIKEKDSSGNKTLLNSQECSRHKDCQESSENNKPTGNEPFS